MHHSLLLLLESIDDLGERLLWLQVLIEHLAFVLLLSHGTVVRGSELSESATVDSIQTDLEQFLVDLCLFLLMTFWIKAIGSSFLQLTTNSDLSEVNEDRKLRVSSYVSLDTVQFFISHGGS